MKPRCPSPLRAKQWLRHVDLSHVGDMARHAKLVEAIEQIGRALGVARFNYVDPKHPPKEEPEP